MLQLKAVHPGDLNARYDRVSARLGPTIEVSHEREITRLPEQFDSFDACVLHSKVDQTSDISTLLAAGKHVLLDSVPVDVTELDRLSGEAMDAGVTFAVCQPKRMHAYSQSIHEGLHQQRLGNPALVRIHRWDAADDVLVPGQNPQSHVWQSFVEEVDLACSLFGSMPTTIFGKSLPAGSDDEHTGGLVGHFGFQAEETAATNSPGMAIVDCALHAGSPYYSASLIGSSGAAYADDHHNTNLLLKNGTRGVNVPVDDWLPNQIVCFLLSIESGERNRSVDELQQAIRVAHACVQSAAANQAAFLSGDGYELR